MSDGYRIDPDYVDVATRIQEFYAKYPDGRLETTNHEIVEVGGKAFAVCLVAASREPDDPRPCHGLAWEPIPGPTPFTRDSELMNAQTSAWGRAIVATGIPSKKIASSDEVRARSGGDAAPPAHGSNGDSEMMTDPQRKRIFALVDELTKLEVPFPENTPDDMKSWDEWRKRFMLGTFNRRSSRDYRKAEARALIDRLVAAQEAWEQKAVEEVPFG